MMKKKLVCSILLTLVLAAVSAVAQTATPSQSTTKTTASSTKPVPSKTAAAASSAKAPSKDSDKLDINRASKEDLMKLSGVGDVYAGKIIAGRPYRTKRDLLTRKILPQATYNSISDKIIAHAAASAVAKK